MADSVRVWEVTVTSADGTHNEGGMDIWGEVSVSPQEIADNLAEIVWRIAFDLATELEEANGSK